MTDEFYVKNRRDKFDKINNVFCHKSYCYASHLDRCKR